MRIAICDDQAIFRREVYSLLEQYKNENMLSFEIVQFASGEELLKYNEDIPLVFLDFEMPGKNGMETAKLLKQKNNDTIIVFLTSHPEMMQNAFEVKAFRYLLKPLERQDLENCLVAALQEQEQYKVILYDNGLKKIVDIYDIYYIEAGENYTYARTKDAIYNSRNTMAKWEEILKGKYFFRCHKTYIVNLASVDEIHTEHIVLYNKEKVLISRRCKKEFQQKLLRYIKDNAI